MACSCSVQHAEFRSLPLFVIMNKSGCRRNLKPRSSISMMPLSACSCSSSTSAKCGRGPDPVFFVSLDTGRKKDDMRYCIRGLVRRSSSSGCPSQATCRPSSPHHEKGCRPALWSHQPNRFRRRLPHRPSARTNQCRQPAEICRCPNLPRHRRDENAAFHPSFSIRRSSR